MKDGVGECLCLGDDCASGAAEQTKPGSGVLWANGPSSPLRAVDQEVFPRGTGWALELAGRRKLGCPPMSPHCRASWPERKSRCSSCRSRRASQPGGKR